MRAAYIGVMNSINQHENGFTKAMRKVFGDYSEHTHVGDVPFDCNLLFLQTQDTGLNTVSMQQYRQRGTYIINWTGDARDQTPKYCYEYAPYIDLTCYSNMRDLDNMRRMGFNSEFLQIGYDPEIYYPDPIIEKDIDVVFFGNNFGHFPLSGLRKQMVAELKRVYGARFKAYGIGQPDGNFMGNQKGEADILRRSKIAINLSHYDLPRYTSDRMFRSLGSGCMVLSHDYQNVTDDFTDVWVWKSFETLTKQIDILLKDDNYRQGWADIQYKFAINNHTFEHMAHSIKELYERNKVNA